MLIEEELFHFLQKKIKSTKRKNRNIEIILYYLGFGDNLWPTLDEVADKFELGTRERIRQIINENFRKLISNQNLKSAAEASQIIKRHKYISVDDLRKLLLKKDLVSKDSNISAVLKLLHSIGLCRDYNIFASDLKRKLTRWISRTESDFFVAKNKGAELLSKLIKKVKTLPGQTGVCCLDNVFKVDGKIFKNYITKEQITEIARASQSAWTTKNESGFWYIFEDRKNVLLNYLAKIYSVAETMDINDLSETLRNALRARTNKYGYPTAKIIREYLRASSYMEIEADKARFLGKPAELNPIEEDIVEYLKNRKGVLYNLIKTHLRNKGHKEAYTVRCILHSPIVSVRRREGKLGHLYSLVGNPHL